MSYIRPTQKYKQSARTATLHSKQETNRIFFLQHSRVMWKVVGDTSLLSQTCVDTRRSTRERKTPARPTRTSKCLSNFFSAIPFFFFITHFFRASLDWTRIFFLFIFERFSGLGPGLGYPPRLSKGRAPCSTTTISTSSSSRLLPQFDPISLVGHFTWDSLLVQ